MTSHDVYTSIHEQSSETLNRIVERLEFRDGHPTFTAWREAYLAKLPLAEAQQVLDVGCGTGVVTRALAKRATTGQVTGVDYSPTLIDAARAKAEALGISGITFQTGDARALEFADGQFDVVVLHTVMSHVADATKVLAEVARVLKPGGVAAFFDGDYASLVLTCPDKLLADKVGAAVIQMIGHNARIMRDLPRLVKKYGLEVRHSEAYVLPEIGAGSFFLSAAEAYAPLTGHKGLVSEQEVETWLAWQREAARNGDFFAVCNYYCYLAAKSGEEDVSDEYRKK